MKRWCLVLVFFFQLSLITTYESSDSSDDILHKWLNITKQTKNLVKGFMKEIRRPLLKTSETKLNKRCQIHLISLMLGLSRAEVWAIRFFSGNGEFLNGFTSMANANYGSYDQCVETTIPDPSRKKQSSKMFFQGQYCSVEISPPLPSKPRFYTVNKPLSELESFSSSNNTFVRRISEYAQVYYFSPLRVGLCMPSSCNVEDVSNLLNSVKGSLPIKVFVRRCETKNVLIVNKEQIIVSCIVGVFLILVAGGSVLDIYNYYFPKTKQQVKKDNLMQIILAFSINKTFRSLLSTENTTHCLRPLYGIHFLTIMWLFVGWSLEETSFNPFHGELRNLNFRKHFLMMPMLNYTVAIDTLFFISGLLTSYIILRKIDQDKNSVRFLFFVIYRLTRITPSLLLVIGVTLCLPWIGSGPMWHDTIDPVIEGCRRNWWTNLLYINNYVGTDKPCLKNSWFFATDFQLYLMALIVVFIISRYPKIGMMCNLTVGFGSMAITGFITWNKKLPPTILFIHPDPEDRKEYFTSLYHLPYPHAGAFCVGITVGYVLLNYPQLTIKWWIQIVGWVFAAVINFFVIYGVFNWNQSYETSTVAGIMYASTHRTAWALVVAWLVIACCMGYGGVINEVLSWKPFEPLSRLTFLAYIVYNLTSAALLGYLKEKIFYQHYYIVGLIITLTIMTYGISFIAGSIWEAPLMTIVQHQKTFKANISRNLNSISKKHFNQNGVYVLTKNN